jgi:uncharacterized membrane protein YvbJ
MFCPKCGQLNLDKVQSCQKCGTRLPASDGAGGSVSAPQAVSATGLYAGFWKRFAALIIDYFVVVVLAVLADAFRSLAQPGVTSRRSCPE